jgi:hypothetical protein
MVDFTILALKFVIKLILLSIHRINRNKNINNVLKYPWPIAMYYLTVDGTYETKQSSQGLINEMCILC